MPKMTDSTGISGIGSFQEGVQLVEAGYMGLNQRPIGYEKYREGEYIRGSAKATTMIRSEGNITTIVVSIAGTDDLFNDIPDNWMSVGFGHFSMLDQDVLNPLIKEAKQNGWNIVICGDSGGGLAAQYAQEKYGVDIFVTNTFGISKEDMRSRLLPDILRFPEEYQHNNKPKTIVVNMDGEILSSSLQEIQGSQTYYVPSEHGAKLRYVEYEDKVNIFDEDYFRTYWSDRVELHKSRYHLLNYTGEIYNKPLNLRTYQIHEPNLLEEKYRIISDYNTTAKLFQNQLIIGNNILDLNLLEKSFWDIYEEKSSIAILLGNESFETVKDEKLT